MQDLQILLVYMNFLFVSGLDIIISTPVQMINCRETTTSTFSYGTVVPLDPKGFYEAASLGDLSIITSELSRPGRADLVLNWRNEDHYGYTALHIAANNSHDQVVRTLLDAGADPNMKEERYGMTPLFITAEYGLIRPLRILLDPKYQADVNLGTNIGQTAGARWVNHNGETPVYVAAQEGNAAVLEILVAHGGDVNKATNGGSTPLDTASQRGYVDIVRTLINAGADVWYVTPNDGNTALYRAAWNNHADVVRLLLQNGANKEVENKYGTTPADVARSYGHDSVARLIDNY